MIQNILIYEIKQFYPVTDSLTQDKIDTTMLFVKNNIFLTMFGLGISNRIFDGTIADNENDNFIGFRRFVALCIASQMIKSLITHTNVGAKVINQSNWSSPRPSEKNTDLMDVANTVESQFKEAKKILSDLGEIPTNKYAGYSSFQIEKI